MIFKGVDSPWPISRLSARPVRRVGVACHLLSRPRSTPNLPQAPGWDPNEDRTKIGAAFRFKNFRQTLEFVKDVGELAETEFHHPLEIVFGWGFCRMTLQTKKIKGLHENDFIMAAKINEIAAVHGAFG